MNTTIYVPSTLSHAASQIRLAFSCPIENLSKKDFVRAWSSIAYLFPGLHPDGFEDVDSGWPRVLKRFAVEAWRRFNAGELTDEELYPCDAQWGGLYDRMMRHTRQETQRRREIASLSIV